MGEMTPRRCSYEAYTKKEPAILWRDEELGGLEILRATYVTHSFAPRATIWPLRKRNGLLPNAHSSCLRPRCSSPQQHPTGRVLGRPLLIARSCTIPGAMLRIPCRAIGPLLSVNSVYHTYEHTAISSENEEWLHMSACHAGRLADNRTPVGSGLAPFKPAAN